MAAKRKSAVPDVVYLDKLDFPAILAAAESVLSGWTNYETKTYDTPTRWAIWFRMQRDLNALEKLLSGQLQGTERSDHWFLSGDRLSDSAIAGKAVRDWMRIDIDVGIDVWMERLNTTIELVRTATAVSNPSVANYSGDGDNDTNNGGVILTGQRRRVFDLLKWQKKSLDQIANYLKIMSSSAHKHVTSLEEMGLIIHVDRQGYYRPDAPPPDLFIPEKSALSKR